MVADDNVIPPWSSGLRPVFCIGSLLHVERPRVRTRPWTRAVSRTPRCALNPPSTQLPAHEVTTQVLIMYCTRGLAMLAVAVVLLALSGCHGLTVMSVDFGSEFMKVAVVAPGVPMEIALNKESKRKTPVAIAFRDGERTFGDDAITAGMRSPSSVFINLLQLLGKPVTHPLVEDYKAKYPQYNIVAHPQRQTVVFKISDDQSFSVEELIAQLLSHARDQASTHTGQKVKDLVITVPAFFNQAERRALLEAADIAGLKVLSLISNNAAVALNYGMFRRKEVNSTAQYLLFYDMGSSQTTASVVSFQTVKTKDKGYSETNPQLTVVGVGYDRTLGGYEMQLRLRDFLARKFNDMKKTSKSVFDNPRAMSKLTKEAGRLKQVLSANTEHVSQVENVMEDIDLRVLVTRAEFEELIEDLVLRSSQPVNDALAMAGVDMSVVDQLVLVGGSTRVPAVQDHLQKLWGRELSRNINADEAAAMGAVYRAADMGQGFKVKTFHVKETNLYPIEVEFDRMTEQEGGQMVEKTVRRSLFAVGNVYPQKKVMTFNKNTADFEFRVNYGDMTDLMTPTRLKQQFGSESLLLRKANIGDVSSLYEKHVVQGGAEFRGIKAHFYLDGSGILHVGDVELVVERNVTVQLPKKSDDESTFTKIGSTLSKLFGGEDEAGDDAGAGNATDDADAAKKAAGDTDAAAAAANGTGTGAAPEPQMQLVTEKLVLNNSVVVLDLPLLQGELLEQSLDKLSTINAAEEARERREAARNSLETLILDIRDKMSQDEYIAASLPDVQEKLASACNTMEDWLYEDGFHADSEAYTSRIKKLEQTFSPVRQRVEEHRQRPQALQALNNMLNMSSDFMQKARSSPESEAWFTTVELQNMDDLIVSTQSWLEQAEEAQALLQPHDDPSLSLNLIADKINDLDREMKYLFNKAKLAKAKADREAAEAKAKAEREAKEAEWKKKQAKEQEDEDEDKDDEEVEKTIETPTKDGSSDEAVESRAEPPLPQEPEPDLMGHHVDPDAAEDTRAPHPEL
ncbi:Heat shock protein 70 family [Trinorchestia longiramus]|nr:Heat shock protein 70 family [Trinorchestia longiramus]